jgi:hypothetical protein
MWLLACVTNDRKAQEDSPRLEAESAALSLRQWTAKHGLCVTPCYVSACRNRGQAVSSTGEQAISLRYFNNVEGGRREEPKRVATCYWHVCISFQIIFRKYSMDKF